MAVLELSLSFVSSRSIRVSDSCSIVAVSAVGADPIETWRAGSSKCPWLEEELLEQLPLARVLYYDHFATRDSDLGSLANFLLEALDRKNLSDNAPAQAPKCPVIFLCHSTGGLVVKKALASAWENHERYPDFVRSCIGVAFFGLFCSENIPSEHSDRYSCAPLGISATRRSKLRQYGAKESGRRI